eukprot:s863_g10.t1
MFTFNRAAVLADSQRWSAALMMGAQGGCSAIFSVRRQKLPTSCLCETDKEAAQRLSACVFCFYGPVAKKNAELQPFSFFAPHLFAGISNEMPSRAECGHPDPGVNAVQWNKQMMFGEFGREANDVWRSTNHAMSLYRRAGLPALAAWEAVLPTSQKTQLLTRACRSVFGFSQNPSFWVGAREQARTVLDRFALQVFWFHTSRLSISDAVAKFPNAGAEFWVQRRGPEQAASERGMDWHFDKDEDLLDQEDLAVMPCVGTVTYFSSQGAPLVVLSEPRLNGPLALTVDDEVTAYAVQPICGRHVAFDGSLLHGCPAQFAPKAERLSLVVNLWFDHKPLGVSSTATASWRKQRSHDKDWMDPPHDLNEDYFLAKEPAILERLEAPSAGPVLPVDFGPWIISGVHLPIREAQDGSKILAVHHSRDQVKVQLPMVEPMRFSKTQRIFQMQKSTGDIWSRLQLLLVTFRIHFSTSFSRSLDEATLNLVTANVAMDQGEAASSSDDQVSVNIFLPSGRSVAVSILLTQTCGELQEIAQTSFGRGFLRLLSADGHFLDPDDSLQSVGLEDGSNLTAVAQIPRLVATQLAFSIWTSGGPAVAWGDPEAGGDCDMHGRRVRSVQELVPAEYAIAAMLTNGQVVSWGDPGSGGYVWDARLRNVKEIVATDDAFAALRADGSVVTFGDASVDCSRLQEELKGVVKLAGSSAAFAAILSTGDVVTWGKADFGGNSSQVQDQLRNVKEIIGKIRNSAFTALGEDGQVLATWGSSRCVASKEVLKQLKLKKVKVKNIDCTALAWAAVSQDGEVFTWGMPCSGGDSRNVQHRLQNVTKVVASHAAFAALLEDGSVVSWGDPLFGGDDLEVRAELKDIVKLFSCYNMFLAIRQDGKVIRWGDPAVNEIWEHHGGHLEIEPLLSNVQEFAGNDRAFAAVLTDGSVLTWGDPKTGGDNKELQETIEVVLGSRVPTPYDPTNEDSYGDSENSEDLVDVLKAMF